VGPAGRTGSDDRACDRTRAVPSDLVSDTTVKGPIRKPAGRVSVPCVRVLSTPGITDVAWRVLGPGTCRVGRGADADLRLAEDDRASRRHAELHHDPEQLVRLVDTSANGVFVNGARVSEATLADGDVLRLGDSILLLRYRDPDEPDEPALPGCIGDSPAAAALNRLVRKIAPTTASILVLGESGTGKELVARGIHELGHSGTPFVAVNCGAIAEGLAESTLFGHVPGAFTGAAKSHPGYFRAADGGVLFLDEVGELGMATQAKLLRALDEHAVTPVGAIQPVACRTRVIAATNKDLHAAVFAGSFRGDLYARLAEVLVVMPTLRTRREDILPIFRSVLGEPSPPLSADLCEALVLHPWPFNIRELRKLAIDVKVRGEGLPLLDLDLVQDRLHVIPERPPESPAPAGPASSEPPGDRGAPPDRDELVRLLEQHRGSVAEIGRVKNRSRKQVYRWLELHELDPKKYR